MEISFDASLTAKIDARLVTDWNVKKHYFRNYTTTKNNSQCLSERAEGQQQGSLPLVNSSLQTSAVLAYIITTLKPFSSPCSIQDRRTYPLPPLHAKQQGIPHRSQKQVLGRTQIN